MDLRVQKTKRSIINAFIGLRAERELEKITVKEICANAMVNKSTFYKHYLDIYDLSDKLEAEVLNAVMDQIFLDEETVKNPSALTKQLFQAYSTNQPLIKLLFSGSRSGNLISGIEQSILERIRQAYPRFAVNTNCILLSYQIYGGYYAYKKYQNCPEIVDILAEVASTVSAYMKRIS